MQFKRIIKRAIEQQKRSTESSAIWSLTLDNSNLIFK